MEMTAATTHAPLNESAPKQRRTGRSSRTESPDRTPSASTSARGDGAATARGDHGGDGARGRIAERARARMGREGRARLHQTARARIFPSFTLAIWGGPLEVSMTVTSYLSSQESYGVSLI